MSDLRQRALTLRAGFEALGASVIEPPVLLSAETLLDLYGEDIRGRAYVTSDALRGEQMLRPDFTVPVVEQHMAANTGRARYTYAGEVFRRQEEDPDRANEYLQVGYEIFDGDDPATADAEVFAAMHASLEHLDLRAATGDIGILIAAVEGLHTSAARKAALMRHLWRPRRFRALLDRYAGRAEVPAHRADLIAGQVAPYAPLTGLRSESEIAARIEALRADASEGPISQTEVEGLDALLSVRETVPYALERMRDVAVDLPSIAGAVDGMHRRTDALQKRGIDIETLEFETSYGRTSMEYYDGFVFGFYAARRADLPPVATGGRYDMLTRRLGRGRVAQAVGAVLRPDLLLLLEETK